MADCSTFNGFNFRSDPHMVEAVSVETGRTWTERLLTRPWRPWIATKTVTEWEPSDEFYLVGSNTIIAHPDRINEVREKLLDLPTHPAVTASDNSQGDDDDGGL